MQKPGEKKKRWKDLVTGDEKNFRKCCNDDVIQHFEKYKDRTRNAESSITIHYLLSIDTRVRYQQIMCH